MTEQPQLGENLHLRLQISPPSLPEPKDMTLWLQVPGHTIPLPLCAVKRSQQDQAQWHDLTTRLPRQVPAGPATVRAGRAQCRLPALRPASPLELHRQVGEVEACEVLLGGTAPAHTAAQLYGLPVQAWAELTDEDYRRAFPVTAEQVAAYACATGWSERHIHRTLAGEPLPLIVEMNGEFSLLRQGGYSEIEVMHIAPTREAIVQAYLRWHFPWLPLAGEDSSAPV